MKSNEKLQIAVSKSEILSLVKTVGKKAMVRKTYLIGRRWYLFHKEILDKLKYRGMIPKYPKHIRLREIKDVSD